MYNIFNLYITALRKKCLYSEFFWSAFSHIRTQTECGDSQSKPPYLV